MKNATAMDRAVSAWVCFAPEIRTGILMFSATGTLAGIHTVIRYLSESINPFEIAFFRSFFVMLVLSPFIFKNGKNAFRTERPLLNLIGGVTSFFAMLSCYTD